MSLKNFLVLIFSARTIFAPFPA